MTVKVYSKPACMQCVATTKELDKRGVEYEKIDLTRDASALERIIALGYRQATVVEVEEDNHWSGFRPDKIAALAF